MLTRLKKQFVKEYEYESINTKQKLRKSKTICCMYACNHKEIFGKVYGLNRNATNNTVKIILQIINRDYI